MKSFFLSLLILSSALISTPVFAQTATEPTAVITWQANTYVPTWYVGKTLPGRGSKISLALMLIDGGKVVDISSKKISWFANENLISSGVGATTATFLTDAALDKNYSIRALIQGYNLKNIEGSTGIRITNPKISLRQTKTSGAYTFEAIPFFFNAQALSELLINWSLDGSLSESQRQVPLGYFELTTPSIGRHLITSSANLKTNTQERAAESITITVQ